MALLHAHTEGNLLLQILDEVVLHGVLDTLKILPFLFLTYLLMEFIEHRTGDKAERFMRKAGAIGPVVGGALGAVPQCGFSAAAASLYAGRVISLGTLIAVFLSTSDEMLPILLAGNIPFGTVALIILYKMGVGILAGLAIDLALRLFANGKENINIDEICDNDNCHCERGIIYSAVHHTITISLFLLAVTVGINALIFFIGEENLGAVMYDRPFISHIIAALFGLVPNCAASVALATLCSQGLITAGTMMAGLFSGAGVGLLVLFRVNKHIKQNLIVLLMLVLFGFAFGLLGDVIFPPSLFK